VVGGADFHWTGGKHGEDDDMDNVAPSTCPSLNLCPTGQAARATRNTTLSPATARRVAAYVCGVFLRAVYGRERGGGSTIRPRVHNDVYDVSVHRSIARDHVDGAVRSACARMGAATTSSASFSIPLKHFRNCITPENVNYVKNLQK
jgi:hypothetical protein